MDNAPENTAQCSQRQETCEGEQDPFGIHCTTHAAAEHDC